MTFSFTDRLAVAALLLWPAIPLFWIPVHCATGFFRRLGFLTYVLPLLTWLPLALVMFSLRALLLQYRMVFPSVIRIVGAVLFLSGAGLQIWTLRLLSAPVIVGMPEVTQTVHRQLTSRGPFAVVRHPTYLSHTVMLLGMFLLTEITAVGIAAIGDALAANFIIMPLEEKELLQRFGQEYEEYRKKVPSRFFPWRPPRERTPD